MSLTKLLVVFVFSFFVCEPTYAQETDTETVEGRTLIAHVNTSIPQSYQDDSGEWVGFEIDRVRDMASRLDCDIEFQALETEKDRFDSLREDVSDIVFGGLTITSERERSGLSFSYPILDSGLSIAVPWSEGQQSGSYLLTVFYALLHLDMFLIGSVAFFVACILMRQLQKKESTVLNPRRRRKIENEDPHLSLSGETEEIMLHQKEKPARRKKQASPMRAAFALVIFTTCGILAHCVTTTRLQDQSSVIAKISSEFDLKGMDVATKLPSTSSQALESLGAHVVGYPDIKKALSAMSSGEKGIEAVVFDSPVLWHYASTGEYGLFRIVAEQFDPQHYGIAVREGEDELLELINRALIEQDEDGTTEILKLRHYGRSL